MTPEPPSEIIASSPSVRTYTAPNPGPKTLSGTNTFFIGKDFCYILDPGPDLPEYADALVRELRRENRRPVAILLSHGHPDHAPGAPRLKHSLRIPIWASSAMPIELRKSLDVDALYQHDQTFPVDGDTLQVVPSPGHTFDHVAFWLQGARVLFSGDTILGEGTTLVAPPEGNMREYMYTLERMQALGPRLIAPGHGPHIRDAPAKIDEYVRHRKERERRALAALADGPASLPDLVRRVYADVDVSLHELAAASLRAQLQKLEEEGRVRRRSGMYERLTGEKEPMDQSD